MINKATPNSFTDLRILLVDDIDSNRFVVMNILRKYSMRIDTATNGVEALERLKTNDYDIILMDLAMPEMDGVTAARIIRSEFKPPKKDIPIIALTASLIQESIDRVYAAGMNACVAKPILGKELIRTIEKLTKSRLSGGSPVRKSIHSGKYPVNDRFDLSYLSQISEGDDKFAAELIESFIRKTPSMLDEIRQNLELENIERCRVLCHKLKPTLSYMGLLEVTPLFTRFHDMLNKVQIDFKVELLKLNEIKDLVTDAITSLKVIRETLLSNEK
jgi:CheY-like chemotaxis protein/HPt (histidine-containing phosphotransfer) domain-containing protein